jgi:hypothetical protein
MAKESEVEKTARFTRHFLQGIVVFFIIVIVVAGVAAFWFYYREQPVQSTVTSATPTPPSGAPLQTPTSTSTPTSTNETSLVGLSVGDTFTYKLTGVSVLFDQEAVTPAYLSEYNNTHFYQVTITGINGSVVTFDTDWAFNNGSAPILTQEWVNVATGANSGDFWAIYPANLTVNDLLSPQGGNGLTVNSTTTQTYADSTRTTNYWSTSTVFTNINDPTENTQQTNIMQVYFDQQTGMLTSLTSIQEYNNPEYNIIITWQLTSTNVWTV